MATTLGIPLQEVQRQLGVDNPWWKAGSGIDIEFVPVAVHCYTIARNLLRTKN